MVDPANLEGSFSPYVEYMKVLATICAARDTNFRIYSAGKLSEVITLKKGAEKQWR